MKKTMYLMIIMMFSVMLLAACGSNNSGNDNSLPTEDVDTALPSGDSALPSDDSTGTQLAGSVMTVAQIEGGLAIGATQEDVSILFDSHPYQVVTAEADGGHVWRYDFGAQADYTFEAKSDTQDHEGILNGDVPLQVFIYFDEVGKVSKYTAYKAGAEGTITVYKTLNDGTRKIETI